jgi:hypothetical protein
MSILGIEERQHLPTKDETGGRTIADEGVGKRLLCHQLEVEGSAISDLVVDVVQAPVPSVSSRSPCDSNSTLTSSVEP